MDNLPDYFNILICEKTGKNKESKRVLNDDGKVIC